jgi:hypothetical protein
MEKLERTAAHSGVTGGNLAEINASGLRCQIATYRPIDGYTVCSFEPAALLMLGNAT